MKKKPSRRSRDCGRDTMRPEYDFSRALRGATATRYREGANIVVIDPSVLDFFPDGRRVNQALRALAPVLRQQRQARSRVASAQVSTSRRFPVAALTIS